jgi:hypothetical protein
MMVKKVLLISLAAIVATGIILYIHEKEEHEKRLDKVADEGYETAWDIHFPEKPRRTKRSWL